MCKEYDNATCTHCGKIFHWKQGVRVSKRWFCSVAHYRAYHRLNKPGGFIPNRP